MNEQLKNKITEYKNHKIYEKYNRIKGLKILNVYDISEIDKVYISAFMEVARADYPKFLSMEFDRSYADIIGVLYDKIGLSYVNYKWLIPRFAGGTQWYEIVVKDICSFLDSYLIDTNPNSFSAFDLVNNVVFDLEKGENRIDVYFLRLDTQ